MFSDLIEEHYEAYSWVTRKKEKKAISLGIVYIILERGCFLKRAGTRRSSWFTVVPLETARVKTAQALKDRITKERYSIKPTGCIGVKKKSALYPVPAGSVPLLPVCFPGRRDEATSRTTIGTSYEEEPTKETNTSLAAQRQQQSHANPSMSSSDVRPVALKKACLPILLQSLDVDERAVTLDKLGTGNQSVAHYSELKKLALPDCSQPRYVLTRRYGNRS